jgi:hypothetical protein
MLPSRRQLPTGALTLCRQPLILLPTGVLILRRQLPTPPCPRGDQADRAVPLRQQILDLLQAHPEGLRAEEIRVYLQARRPIGDTLQGMLKGGVITAQGQGIHRRYVLAE